MTGIVDLNRERAKREEPDADCVRKDDFGQPLYLYALEYSFDDKRWAAEIWAYSMEEAQARVDGMRQPLVLCGQTFAVVPA